MEVRGASRQRGQFLAGGLERVRVLAHLRLGLPLGLRFVLFVFLKRGAQFRDLTLGLCKRFFVRRCAQVRERELPGKLGRAFSAAVAFHLEARDLFLPIVDFTAAGALALFLQLSEVAACVSDVLGESVAVRAEPVLVARETVLFVGEEAHEVLGRENINIVAAIHEFASARARFTPHLVGFTQAREHVALLARGHERVVYLGKVLEVREGLISQVKGSGLVEHVVAKQRIDVAELLRGLDLVEKPECFLVGNAEDLAKACAVFAELAERLGALESLFELAAFNARAHERA